MTALLADRKTLPSSLKDRVKLVSEQKAQSDKYRRTFLVVLSGESEARHESVYDLCDEERQAAVMECNLVNTGNRFYKVVIFK